ncbi:MAG: hypothetical protein KGY48_10455, partial [Wenzhouxiangellaceae bacterium]|nr:hypothetical protein [Wenzhouxiangellaceae bacterium]
PSEPVESAREREATAQPERPAAAPPAGGTAGSGQTAGGSGATTAEQRSDATEAAQNSDERFTEAMRRFDGRLARERFGAAGGADGPAGSDGGSGSGGGQADDADQSGSGTLAGSGNPFEEGRSDDEQDPNATGRGGIGQRSSGAPPPGTPDGSDDDIVARQLREAAETETDPALRARLWEEYRAYKNDQI